MRKVYAFIPARSGSTRLPNKNIYPFHNKPLAQWTIELAQKSGVFDRIYVSTDIDYLLDNYQVEKIRRPDSLANSQATILEVIQNTLATRTDWNDDDLLMLLLVTGPLRVTSDIHRALDQFDDTERVVSVSKNLQPPMLSWKLDGNQLAPMQESSDPYFTRKQNHEDTFMFNDILVLDSVRGWRERQANLFGKNPIPLIIPPERTMPIDYAVQMRCAEALFPPYDERNETFEWDLENDS